MIDTDFIRFDEVKIDFKYVVYSEESEGVLYFTNDITHDALQYKLPKLVRDIRDIRKDRLLTSIDRIEVDVWTFPFEQKDYGTYLQKYAELLTGKGCNLGDLSKKGWTKHTINV